MSPSGCSELHGVINNEKNEKRKAEQGRERQKGMHPVSAGGPMHDIDRF